MSDDARPPTTRPTPAPAAAGGGRARPKSSLRLSLARAGALLVVVALTVGIYLLGDRVEQLQALSYPGIFLISLLGYATVILPAPVLALVFAWGGKFSPVGVALAAGAGAALGELSGYLAGFSGQAIIENRRLYERLESGMRRYGPIVIAVLAFIPSPFFDLAGIAAGALRMSVARFLLWCAVGQILKMLVVAHAGAYSVEWVLRLLE
jgi:membrane protein DedA with SNARE-associated domain